MLKLWRKPLAILAVDDDPRVIESIRISFGLRWPEAEVLMASNGRSALDIVRDRRPDIVLLDTSLPDIDVFEVRRRIRELTRSPVLWLVAVAGSPDAVDLSALDGDPHITKPFSHSELVSRTRAIWKKIDPLRKEASSPKGSHPPTPPPVLQALVKPSTPLPSPSAAPISRLPAGSQAVAPVGKVEAPPVLAPGAGAARPGAVGAAPEAVAGTAGAAAEAVKGATGAASAVAGAASLAAGVAAGTAGAAAGTAKGAAEVAGTAATIAAGAARGAAGVAAGAAGGAVTVASEAAGAAVGAAEVAAKATGVAANVAAGATVTAAGGLVRGAEAAGKGAAVAGRNAARLSRAAAGASAPVLARSGAFLVTALATVFLVWLPWVGRHALGRACPWLGRAICHTAVGIGRTVLALAGLPRRLRRRKAAPALARGQSWGWWKAAFYTPVFALHAGAGYYSWSHGENPSQAIWRSAFSLLICALLIEIGFAVLSRKERRHTYQMQAEQERTQALRDVSLLLSSSADLRTALDVALDCIPLPGEANSLLVLSNPNWSAAHVTAVKGPARSRILGVEVQWEEVWHMLQAAIHRPRPGAMPEPFVDASHLCQNLGELIPALSESKWLILFPLLSDDRSYGFLAITSNEEEEPSTAELETLTVFSRQIGAAVNGRWLEEVALRGKREWQATVDAIRDGTFLIDNTRTILRGNHAFAAMVGLEVCEVPGRKCYEVLPECAAQYNCAQAEVGPCPAENERRIMREGRRLRLIHQRAIEVQDASYGSVLSLQDVTKEEVAREEADLRSREVDFLNGVLLRASSSLDLRTIMGGVVDELSRLTGERGGWAYLTAAGRNSMLVTRDLPERLRTELEASFLIDITGRLQRAGESHFVLKDIQPSSGYGAGGPERTQVPALVLALHSKGVLLGHIGLVCEAGSGLAERDMHALTRAAQGASMGLENAILFERARTEADRWAWLAEVSRRLVTGLDTIEASEAFPLLSTPKPR